MRKLFIVSICTGLLLCLSGCALMRGREDIPEDPVRGVEYTSGTAWANWTEDGSIAEACSNSDLVQRYPSAHLPVFRISSEKELEEFAGRYRAVFELEQGHDEVPSFREMTEDMDSGFFKKNELFLVYVEASSGTFRYDTVSVSVTDGELLIAVCRTSDPEVYDTMMAGWFVAVTTEKSGIKDVISVDAVMAETITIID